jgi:hypothetical protein
LATGALCCSASCTALTRVTASDRDLFFASECSFLEGYIEVVAEIVASSSTSTAALLSTHLSAEKRAKNVTKDIFEPGEVSTREATASSATVGECCVTEAVIPRTILGIA